MSEENKVVTETKETVEKKTPATETKETVEKETVTVTPVTVEKEEVKEKPKRKNKKRKQEIINNLQEKEEEEEAPSKRVKITKDVEQQEDSEPSLWKGAILKPALLGILAGASFYVNHMLSTSKPKARQYPPLSNKPQQQKKNTTHPFLRVQPKSSVPGFV